MQPETYRDPGLLVAVAPRPAPLLHRFAHWLGLHRTRLLTVETVMHQGCGGQVVMITECATCSEMRAHQLRRCDPCLGVALARYDAWRDFRS